MKIRYYKNIDGWRWLGFILAMIGAFILSNADVTTQWMGWAIATVSCSIWITMGIKDRDTPRALMELMYLPTKMHPMFGLKTQHTKILVARQQ